ncbi:hypothetical protein N7475_005495 [Penicillium sp. IBT 31633x]|nr:hypothetical protein N7475_005495 [Penicillium sp. IBT 31633x]
MITANATTFGMKSSVNDNIQHVKKCETIGTQESCRVGLFQAEKLLTQSAGMGGPEFQLFPRREKGGQLPCQIDG